MQLLLFCFIVSLLFFFSNFKWMPCLAQATKNQVHEQSENNLKRDLIEAYWIFVYLLFEGKIKWNCLQLMNALVKFQSISLPLFMHLITRSFSKFHFNLHSIFSFSISLSSAICMQNKNRNIREKNGGEFDGKFVSENHSIHSFE